MYLQEAFVKIAEQAKAYLETKGEVTAGLNLINSTNLEYFPAKHKAEIFRLKGDFFLKLNDSENANLAYSNAITLFKNLPKGWISWGSYCDMVSTIIFLKLLLSITVNLSFILIHHLL
jgi:transformation/transcription domain-associated protein